MCKTGGARRSWLHGLEDVTKRYLMYVAGKNLGVIMRSLFGMGKPRTLQTEGRSGFSFVWARIVAPGDLFRFMGRVVTQPIHLAETSAWQIVARFAGLMARPVLAAS